MDELSSSAITAREWCWRVVFRLFLSTPMWSSSTAYSKDSITSALDLFLNLLYFAVESVGLLITGLIFWCFPGGHAWGKYYRKIRSSSTIPGSHGLPFVGSIGLMSGLAHRHLAKEARRLKAERLMAFSVGECRVVITSHPDVAKEILNSSAFVNRKAKESAYKLMFHRSIGFAPYGVYWRTLRKIAEGHLFSLKQITAWQPVRSEIASEMVSEIRKMNKNNKEVRARDVLKPAALNNIMWMVFGRRYVIGSNEKKQEFEELHKLLQEGYELLGKVDWADHFPMLSSFDLQGIRSRCNALVPKINHFVNRIVREQRPKSREKDGDIQSFIDVLFSLQKREKNLSDSDINAILWEMVFRGADAVGVLMEWVMARMVLHPDIQEKAQEELDRVVGRSRTVAGTDMKELVYIQAVVKETLRLHPPGPLLSWARLSTCDTTVDGHHVPAGTTGMVNMWAISQDRQVWDEPMLFRPERFVHGGGEEREIISIMGSDLRLAPFGSGRRSCPGKTLGISSVEFWIATLLHEYKWGPAASVDLSEDLRLTCEMKNPLVVNVLPRPRN